MFVFVQVPLFWHGLNISHRVWEILQLIPISVGFGQVNGTKETSSWKNKDDYIEGETISDMQHSFLARKKI